MNKIIIAIIILTVLIILAGCEKTPDSHKAELIDIAEMSYRAGFKCGFEYTERRAEFKRNYKAVDANENETEKWRQRSLSWQYAAEHYGGICKWLLENKPIYGTIVMEANTILSDCLIVSGSKEASVVVEGASGYLVNNHFMAIDMDWVISTTAIDPNDAVEANSITIIGVEINKEPEIYWSCPNCGKRLDGNFVCDCNNEVKVSIDMNATGASDMSEEWKEIRAGREGCYEARRECRKLLRE